VSESAKFALNMTWIMSVAILEDVILDCLVYLLGDAWFGLANRFSKMGKYLNLLYTNFFTMKTAMEVKTFDRNTNNMWKFYSVHTFFKVVTKFYSP